MRGEVELARDALERKAVFTRSEQSEPTVVRPRISGSEPRTNRLLRGIVVVAVAVVIWNLPIPAGVAVNAWHLFAIFFATIIGLILQPLPMGAVVLLRRRPPTALTGTLSIADALNGYMNATVWLIVAAFLFARAFSKTGLGRRIAYVFIGAFGHRTLGLAYALGLADLVLAPGIPSGAARTGGVLFPIVKSLADDLRVGTRPDLRAHRHVPHALRVPDPLGHLRDVHDLDGGQSADRRTDAEDREHRDHLGGLGDGGARCRA